MKRSSKWPGLALVAVILLAVVGTNLYGQGQSQNQAPGPARSRADEMLDKWNDIGNKLIAMAHDFPEDKYDFKVQKDERTFAPVSYTHLDVYKRQGESGCHVPTSHTITVPAP